jgi:hypothetical protein
METPTATHMVKMEVVVMMTEMESTPEASAEVAMALMEEIMNDQAPHWEAKVVVMECWDKDEEEVSRQAVEL